MKARQSERRVSAVCAVVLGAAVALSCGTQVAQAQGSTIWRCGNEYTNQPGPNPAARGCREVHGGNLTIVQGARTGQGSAGNGASARGASAPVAGGAAARSPAERVDPDQQRQRDAEARRILEQELRRAEERLLQARADYADGRPPRRAHEAGEAAYQARVQELRTRVERAEADVAAIRREMGRLGASAGETR